MKTLQEIQEHYQNDKFATHAGCVITEADENRVVCEMPLTEKTQNAHGGVMGGAIFTLADFAFAALTNDRDRLVVAQQVSISYLAAPKGGRLVATARYRKDGRSSCVVNVDVSDDTGRDVAQFVGTGFKLESR